ncbi:hypothetical protein ARMSODRAFT_165929 [Armillaria solidipes]|uniref:Uncharacterized protein n=1 Tax=Armillaria solidipes TaxID=1076256 RepID=A0A2H3C020_9AGAR|nr:hypothetical protein ARMSODRAFT_165929 [Armillaria solidipes]
MTLFTVLTERWIHQYIVVSSSGKQASCTSNSMHGLGATRCGFHQSPERVSTTMMQADTVFDGLWYRALLPCEFDSSHHEKVQRHYHQLKRFRQPVADSLDVTIALREADTNSHLFLLLALQDSEYQLVFGNAIRYTPDLVDVKRNDQYSRGCIVLKSFKASLRLPSKTLSASTRVPDVSRSSLQDALYPTSMGDTG